MRTKKLLALLTALCVLFLQFTSMPVTAATVGDLVVEGGAADADYRYNADRGVLEILSGTPLVIRNANPDAATSQRIFIRRDVAADITLAGVRIDNSGVSGVSAISAGAGSNASVTIRLQEGSVNTLKSGPYATPLQKEGGGDLIVSGSGTLIAEGGNEFASSIGASAFRPESGVVIQGGSIFASKFASQPVDGGGSPVFRYVVSIPTYPNATVTGMNIAGASFDASGLKTNSNGDLSIFLPDQAGVSGDITLQVGEESVTVPEGQYEVKAPVAVNVEVSGSGQATATPQKMQPSDLVTVHAKPDNGASVASVADYTRVGKTSWSGPYRETVAVSFGQAAAGFNVEGGSAGSDYAFRGDSLFILSGTPLTISNVNPGSEVDQNIEIPADVGANITLNNVNINLSQKPYMPAINIADGSAANVSITVADNSRNTLVPGSWSAAIQKNGTDGVGTLTIGGNGTGLLRALGTQSSIGTFAAAIGGARAGTANIVIEGGKIFTSDAAVGIGAISGFSANNLVVTGGNLITDFSEQPTNGQAPVFKTTVVVEGGADSIVESLQGVDYGTGYDGRLGLFSRDNGDGVLNAYLPSGSQITGGNVDGTEYQAASPIVTTEDGTAEGVLSQAAAFVGVQDVELAQREVMTGESLELVGIVSPEDATVKNIDWSLASDGDTGASLEGNVLHTGTAGTVVVTATIEGGTTEGDFTKNFEINVTSSFVAVEDITLQYSEVEAGQSLELITTITPEDASNKSIEWGIANDGDTGASLEGNVLHSGTAGTVVVTATIEGGTTDGDFTKNFEINVTSSFVAVEDITLQYNEVEAGQSLELITTITPEDASNKSIEWGIANDGDTGASLEGNVLHSGTAGTVVVTATIMDGGTDGDFTKNFEINVTSSFVPVEDITLAATEVDAGESLELSATVAPESASNQAIDWSIVNDGDTGAWLEGNVLRTGTAGTVSIQATVPGGATDGDFTKIFDITVRDVFVPVEDITLEFTELDAGDSLELIGTVTPDGASNKDIQWSIADGGGTEAWFDGNVLHTINAGTVVVTATIQGGATDGDFSKNFDITVREIFVPVEDITLASTEVDAGDSLELVATVAPEDASNKSIEWGIADGGGTEAWFEGNVLQTKNAGTVVVTATIMDGTADGHFTKNFDITVRDVFVPVEDISLEVTELDAGDSLELIGTVTPEDASSKSIEWSIANDDGVGAWFDGNVLHTQNAGAVVVTATIRNGATDGDFSKNFDITVREIFVPVEDITLASTEVDAGDSLELVATIAPEDASNKSIEWGIVDGGGTEAWFDGNVLHTQNAGKVVVTATIMDGAADGNFTKNFDITVRDVFVPVEDITLASTEVDAGDSLELVATIAPEDASNKSIEWGIEDGGGTEAWFDGNVLHTQNAGKVVVTATIMDGAADGNFTKNFDITVRDVFVPVEDITLEVTELDAGDSLELVGTVTPEDASNKSIEWSIASDDGVGASFDGNVLHTQNAGTVVVTATIRDGATDGDFTKNFDITVREIFVPVEDITLESTTVDAGESLELVATVTPEDASNKSIEWSIADGGDTGASFEGNVLHTQNAGTVLVTATVMGGATDGDFTKNFEITVRKIFVPVEDITLESTSFDAGQSLELVATVTPEEASNKSIEWSIADGGDTGASFEGNVLHTQSAGTVLVTATVMDGATDGNFTKNFEITVRDVFVPVEDITLESTSVDAGQSLELVATVTPEDASNKSIEWSIADGGDTGASFEGNVLHTQSAGTVVVTATILDGVADGNFTKNFNIVVGDVFVPVEDISLAEDTVDAGESLELVGTVSPDTATNDEIQWSLVDAGTTGATLEGNVLSTASGGKVLVTGSIIDGLAEGQPYSETFEITVDTPFVPVESITLDKNVVDAGDDLTLTGAVLPEDATNRSIVWDLVDAGTTGATLADGVLSTVNGGTAKVTATVQEGLGSGADFVQEFEIEVRDVFVPVTDISMLVTDMVVGESVTLESTVEPANATDTSVSWSITDDGGTGANLAVDVLTAERAGTIKLTATVADGFAVGEGFTKDFEITVHEAFVAVADIQMDLTEVTVGEAADLAATVLPEDATNKTIVWSVTSGEASISDNKLTAAAPGDLVLEARIADGKVDGDFVKTFNVKAVEGFVPVQDITLAEDTFQAGATLELVATIVPEGATNKDVSFSIADDGGTDATLDGNKVSAPRPGKILITAEIADGMAPGQRYVKDFTLTVEPIPVTDIVLDLTAIESGDTVELEGRVEPENASYKTIVWELVNADTTGAVLDGTTLKTTAGGRVVLKAKVEKGLANGEPFEKYFEIEVNQRVILVSEISLEQDEMLQGETLNLSGTIVPADATNKAIKWSLKDAGTTGATLNEAVLSAPNAGTATVTATVEQGDEEAFVQDFKIMVHAVFVAVEDIIDIPTELEAGDSLLLAGTITPDNATNKNIYWAMTSAGTTRSTLIDGTLTTAAGGTVKLTAKVRNGVAIGEDFVKHFEITVNDAGQTPTTPVFKVNLPPSVNVVVGNLVTFTVEMEESNAEEVRYAWYKDGELIAGANEPTLTIEEAADTDAGQYKVVVTNVLNDQEAAAESTVSELRVTAAPIVNYQIYFGSQQTFRGGNIGLMFGTNIPFEKFNSLSINGVVTPVNQYDARPGSTIIEISANYLNMFKNGTYHMRINAVDGFAEVTFYVQRDTEPSETVEVAPITTATVTPTPTPPPTETSPVTTDPRETTIITYPTTTETTPDITRTGEGSSLIYIIAGIGLLALAGVILILTMRKRRDDEFEDDDQDRPI